ncbi:MAG: hypothetical protein ACK4FG_04685 [Brevundimonas sp.]
MPDHNKSKPSFTDNLANLLGEATTDIRHKLVEEAWFGRSAGSEPSNYYESFWKRHGMPNEPGPKTETPSPQQDQEIER